jgi:hypothetical protein
MRKLDHQIAAAVRSTSYMVYVRMFELVGAGWLWSLIEFDLSLHAATDVRAEYGSIGIQIDHLSAE